MGLRISKEVATRLPGVADAFDRSRPVALDDLRSARGLAAELSGDTGTVPLSAGRLTATLELAAVLRRRLEEYFEAHPEVIEKLVDLLSERATATEVDEAFAEFQRLFLEGTALEVETDRRPSETAADLGPLLLESILVWALDSNPATAAVSRELQGRTIWSCGPWRRLIGELSNVLEVAPPLDTRSRSLAESLRAPVEAAPDSLPDQLRYLLGEWADLEDEERSSLVGSLDLIAEEEAPRFPPGPGPVELPDFDDFEDVTPNYSTDLHWMEPLVLMAKNGFVWLDQLSRQYGREIARLDQIPARELDQLSEWGVSGLWLIGIWERSGASARIKRRLGNPEALASAYSLRSYSIAQELGGAEAVDALAEQAAERGIRLAADMVPNHMGIDSDWLIDHPERFLAVRECPFPTYSFEGPDLSPDSRVGIYLEDHYWDRTDAAVVFKRVDRESGETRYVYHGNDGTSTPWNDTAQLDYLNPETRRAVLETILGVAERFPIIRFDAAMTLARRHIQRLWFPEPGAAGAIPSRSEHTLSKSDFQRAMPSEFWRDVVDRVAVERPDTLLLAEAFWLMEGYFVRTLGMHRVYNSAFMNLLRDGDTAKLKRMLRETIDFDPRILKRYVNFLSNPDEATAVEQFGTGDRYFGACVVLATLPGLPMLAHGQFEGYREKYGMEFRRARLQEEPDQALLGRHRREIVPLLRRRDRFAGVDDFRLLDLVDASGEPNEHVLAYVNGRDKIDRTIVLFNNSAEPARGILAAVARHLEPEPDTAYRFRDRTTGLHYLARAEDLLSRGMRVDLGPFESRVLLGFRPVLRAVEGPYLELAEHLDGRGVRNVELELELLDWLPLVKALREMLVTRKRSDRLRRRVVERVRALREEVDAELLSDELGRLGRAEPLRKKVEELPWPSSQRMELAKRRLLDRLAVDPGGVSALGALGAVTAIKRALGDEPGSELATRLLEELTQGPARTLDPGTPDPIRVLAVALEEDWLRPSPPPGRAELARYLDGWLRRPDAPWLFGLNRHADQEWVRQEHLELFLEWRWATGLIGALADLGSGEDRGVSALGWLEAISRLESSFSRAGYAVGAVRSRLGRVEGGDGTARVAADAGRGRPRRRRRRRKRRRPNRPS